MSNALMSQLNFNALSLNSTVRSLPKCTPTTTISLAKFSKLVSIATIFPKKLGKTTCFALDNLKENDKLSSVVDVSSSAEDKPRVVVIAEQYRKECQWIPLWVIEFSDNPSREEPEPAFKELRERIQPYFLRRLKSEVFNENDSSTKLSKKNEIIVWLRLTSCLAASANSMKPS